MSFSQVNEEDSESRQPHYAGMRGAEGRHTCAHKQGTCGVPESQAHCVEYEADCYGSINIWRLSKKYVISSEKKITKIYYRANQTTYWFI